MPLSALDDERLRQALALAEGVIGLTDPNPRVGCVIGSDDGRIFGRGATQQAGGPHAEVVALREAGAQAAGATAWVTLEPCAHHGRTPPCCDALVAAGIARVVVALQDPFPLVAGAGIARLRAAGIEVVMAEGATVHAAHELNIGFFSRVQRGRPWVRLKVAASLDGRTALPNGASQWITGAEARADGHAWRRRASAVLTGVGTVLADDPRLDVRLVPTPRQPLRVVLDSAWRTPPAARVLQPPGGALVIGVDGGNPAPLAAAGAEVLALPAAHGRVPLAGTLEALAARGVNELHVEAGAVLNGALLQAGLVDEVLAYVAPSLLGDGRPFAQLGPFATLDERVTMCFEEAVFIGSDLRMRARIPANKGVGGDYKHAGK